MTRTLKSITDSDLDLASGGSTLIADDLAQAAGAREDLDTTSGGVTAGNQGGGSAGSSSISQNFEPPA